MGGRARRQLRFVPSPALVSPLAAGCRRVLGAWGTTDGGTSTRRYPGRGRRDFVPQTRKGSHLGVANARISGPNPPSCRLGVVRGVDSQGDSKEGNLCSSALCRPPGDGGRREVVVGLLGPPGGASAGRGEKGAPGPRQLLQWPRAAPRDFSPCRPPFPVEEAAAAGPQGTCLRGRPQRGAASQRLREVRAGCPSGASQVAGDCFGDPGAPGCPPRPVLPRPSAPVHLSGGLCVPSRGCSSLCFPSSRSAARRHPRPAVSASLMK